MLISPDSLISDGLLAVNDRYSNLPSDVVDYDAVVPCKTCLLEIAWKNFKARNRDDLRENYDEFRAQHEHWLEDYG